MDNLKNPQNIGGSSPQYLGGGHSPMASALARAPNGGLGAEPPVRSRSKAPGQGIREVKAPEAQALLVFGRSMEAKNFPTFLKFGNAKKSDICDMFAKNYGKPQNWGMEQNCGGLCPSPGLGLKPPLPQNNPDCSQNPTTSSLDYTQPI